MGKAYQKNMKKTKKPSNPTSTTLHPPYFQMIGTAITTMKNRKGSSQQAILKFMLENYGSTLPPTFGKILSVQLKRLADDGRVIKVNNSYKIATTATTAAAATTVTAGKIVESKVKSVAKTKRLSQVKTPETLKTTKTVSKVKREKMKRLSLVKTPEALKRSSSRVSRK